MPLHATVVASPRAWFAALLLALPAFAQDEPGAAPIGPPDDGLVPERVDPMVGPPLGEIATGGALQQVLAPVLQSSAVRRATTGIQVVRVSDGEEVFSSYPDRPLLPASTTKLVTAAAALDILGPSYTFTTDVLVDGEIRGGVLDGNLYLQGHADPTLVAEKLWRLLKDVRNDGIDRITGDIVFDESFFDEGYLIPGWDNREDLERGVTYFPPVGALALDFGALTINVRPGAEVGQKGIVALATDAPGYVEIENALVTARDDTRSRVSIERRIVGEKIKFIVSGSIAIDAAAQHHRRTMHDPTAYTMAVVRGLLDDVGIELSGTLRRGTVPESGARQIHRLYSPPLASVLMDTNKYSSNFMAEMVIRTLGAEKRGRGTTDDGVKVVSDYLDRIGVPRTDYRLRNGSGLSRETEIAPSVLTAVLLDMAANHRVGPEFIASLSIAGRDGTLVSRMTDIAGRVRGKTGTLGGVHCLAGYAEGDDGELYAYAFLVNDVRSVDAVKAVQDEFLRDLVSTDDPEATATP